METQRSAKRQAKPKGLSVRQARAAALEASPEWCNRPLKDIAEELGIRKDTLSKWRKKDEYKRYREKLVQQYAEDMLPYAWQCLKDRMAKDTQAIRLYFELLGQHRQRLEVTGEGGGPVMFGWLHQLSDEQLERYREQLEKGGPVEIEGEVIDV